MDKLDIITELEKERDSLIHKLESLNTTIITLKQSMSYNESSSNGNGKSINQPHSPILESFKINTDILKYKGYTDAKTNKEKVAIILRVEKRFLHMRQIVKIAQSLDRFKSSKEVFNGISQAVYQLKSSGSIVNFKHGNSNIDTFWGSKSWLNDDNTIKSGYEYDEDQIQSAKSENIEI